MPQNKFNQLKDGCPLNPELALCCPERGKINGVEGLECKTCGWNPVVADKRHKDFIKAMEAEREARRKLEL